MDANAGQTRARFPPGVFSQGLLCPAPRRRRAARPCLARAESGLPEPGWRTCKPLLVHIPASYEELVRRFRLGQIQAMLQWLDESIAVIE